MWRDESHSRTRWREQFCAGDRFRCEVTGGVIEVLVEAAIRYFRNRPMQRVEGALAGCCHCLEPLVWFVRRLQGVPHWLDHLPGDLGHVRAVGHITSGDSNVRHLSANVSVRHRGTFPNTGAT